MVVNIADILCFSDEAIPRIQAPNVNKLKSPVTREQVLAAKAAHPELNRYQLAEQLGCSEQTIDRRLAVRRQRGQYLLISDQARPSVDAQSFAHPRD